MDLTHISLGGFFSGLLGYVGRLGWQSVQKDRKLLSDIHMELSVQRTNCLTTIQEQGRETIEILDKINSNVVEQNGFMRGYIEGGRK